MLFKVQYETTIEADTQAEAQGKTAEFLGSIPKDFSSKSPETASSVSIIPVRKSDQVSPKG